MTKYKNKKSDEVFVRYQTAHGVFYTPERQLDICLHSEAIVRIPAYIIEDSNDWELVREVLFRTEDGYDVHERDQVWYVNRKFELRFWRSGVRKKDVPIPGSILKSLPGYKFFALEENARKYIQETEPRYSYNDIMNILEHVRRNNGITPGNIEAVNHIVKNAPTKIKVNG
jgi:hypothetical protein